MLKTDYERLNSVQKKIAQITDQYKELSSWEYQTVVEEIRKNRNNQANAYGSLKGDHVMERAIKEVPETLYVLMTLKLSPEELKYWNSKEGNRWFVRLFPEFSLVEKV